MLFKNSDSSLTNYRENRKKVQQLVFLLLWPLFNLILISSLFYEFGVLTLETISITAFKLWSIFGLSFLAITLIEKYFSHIVLFDSVFRQLIVTVVIVVLISIQFPPIIDVPSLIGVESPDGYERKFILARIVLLLEIIIYVAVMRLMHYQNHTVAVNFALIESELNTLRSQSNPHFLFNTLNLINSEISSDPENAQEIIYDLSDLLRKNITLAQQRYITLAEEIKLVSLYLSLQEKRFKNRLSFEVNIEQECNKYKVPSLLLQPVVENTIKYAVAPYAAKAHIRVLVEQKHDHLNIVFYDTGPNFDDSQIEEGNGFRILRQILSIEYKNDYELSLESTEDGGVLTISIPTKYFTKE